MGLVASRINLNTLQNHGRRRSQQEDTPYNYSLNKSFFSNYFFMGGERFEVSDPDYLFGENCDLNFLSCSKPYTLPYKQAQQFLLSSLSNKQKPSNKTTSCVSRFRAPFNVLSNVRRRANRRSSASSLSNSSANNVASSNNIDPHNKQDAQTQTLHKNSPTTEPSQPLVIYININKATLKLLKSPAAINPLDSERTDSHKDTNTQSSASAACAHTTAVASGPNQGTSWARSSRRQQNGKPEADEVDGCAHSSMLMKRIEPDAGSLLSATSSIKSGYTSIKNAVLSEADSTSIDDDEFKDALNEPTNFGGCNNDDDQSSRLTPYETTKENRDIRIQIEPGVSNTTQQTSSCIIHPSVNADGKPDIDRHLGDELNDTTTESGVRKVKDVADRVYNIEFCFDADVDCSIRIFYFCTRELSSTGITYKPQHATYKSDVYYYKRGHNQKFVNPDHTFQPYLFDEDLLIYKPLDVNGNYNSGAVFPIVIHCVAMEGPSPRQSHSLVATVEKSPLDGSYSIKPLKQLIFADGIQYILQDIYGIENKQMSPKTLRKQPLRNSSLSLANNRSTGPSQSISIRSQINDTTSFLSDTQSLTSLGGRTDQQDSATRRLSRHGSMISETGSACSRKKSSLGIDTNNTSFECVICMSDERDTMLLPCRHLCLCSACAQSLRYQANSCPICRCPFKAALNLRPIQQRSATTRKHTSHKQSGNIEQKQQAGNEC